MSRLNRPITLVTLVYGLLIAGWLFLSQHVYLTLSDAHHLRRMLLSSNTEISPARLQEMWTDVSTLVIVGLSLVLAAIYIFFFFRHLSASASGRARVQRAFQTLTARRWHVATALLLFSSCVVAVAILTGARHDYLAYCRHWSRVLAGGTPWVEQMRMLSDENAYGPLYNLLAVVYGLHPLAPKLLFCLVWLGAAWFVSRRYQDRFGAGSLEHLAAVLFLFANPFFWLTIAGYGLFDILPAMCCIVAVSLRLERRFVLAGVVLGVGSLLKFYPVFMVPFLMIDQRRPRFAVVLGCMGVIAGGLLTSWAFWGASTLAPIVFAAERRSKMLSIFRFLRGRASPLRLVSGRTNVDALSIYAVVLSWAAAFWACYSRRIEPSLAAAVGLFTVLTFNKIGHAQLYTGVVLLVPLWYVTSQLPSRLKHKILRPFSLFLTGLILFQIVYSMFGRMYSPPASLLRGVAGLPSFVLSVWAIASALRWGQVDHDRHISPVSSP